MTKEEYKKQYKAVTEEYFNNLNKITLEYKNHRTQELNLVIGNDFNINGNLYRLEKVLYKDSRFISNDPDEMINLYFVKLGKSGKPLKKDATIMFSLKYFCEVLNK